MQDKNKMNEEEVEILTLQDEEGTSLDAARHPLQTVRAFFAEDVPAGAILRKMIQNP